MKKVLFLMVIMLGGVSARAYDYPYLNVQKSDGTEQSLSVASLTLTVSNGELIAVNENGTQRFTLSELSKMYFSETSTGIAQLEQDGKAPGNQEVYDLSGRKVAALKTGIYVVKQNGGTRKVVMK